MGPAQRQTASVTSDARGQIEKALSSKDPGDAKAIADVNRASEGEKLALIRILAYQGWVGPRDEWKIEEIWGSFKDDVPRVAATEIVLWQHCTSVGAKLDQLASVKQAQKLFMSDVQNLALLHIRQNQEYVKQERSSLGIDSAQDHAPTPEQNKKLADTQALAKTVAEAQKVERDLRQIWVGDELEFYPEGPPMWVPVSFDPTHPPSRNRSGESGGRMASDWEAVNEKWKPVVSFIREKANVSVSIYTLIQAGEGPLRIGLHKSARRREGSG